MQWNVTFIVPHEETIDKKGNYASFYRASHSKEREHFSKTTRIDLVTTVAFIYICAHTQSSVDNSTYYKNPMTIVLRNKRRGRKATHPSIAFQCKSSIYAPLCLLT